eukprot:snap_masked-scaffold_25-processed-gene-1.19-mRNA-1 protein AED:0.09 eAED:1.00 QI:0/0/0/1/1/1/2/0/281
MKRKIEGVYECIGVKTTVEPQKKVKLVSMLKDPRSCNFLESTEVENSKKLDFLQKKTSRKEKFEPDELKTLFIFDYDDTLFPTKVVTFLTKQQKLISWKDLHMNENLQDFFEVTDLLIVDILNKTLHLSNFVKVVSNGTMSWIKGTCKKFLPETYSLLFKQNKIEVISAQDLYSNRNIWKKFCFRNVFERSFETELQRFRRGESALFLKNFISIGDGNPELKAAESIKNSFPHLFVKSVVLSGKKSCEDFYYRLETILDQLDEYEAAEENKIFCVHSSSNQ